MKKKSNCKASTMKMPHFQSTFVTSVNRHLYINQPNGKYSRMPVTVPGELLVIRLATRCTIPLVDNTVLIATTIRPTFLPMDYRSVIVKTMVKAMALKAIKSALESWAFRFSEDQVGNPFPAKYSSIICAR